MPSASLSPRTTTTLCARRPLVLVTDDKLFPYLRQTVTRRIHKLIERAGRAPFKITAHTFRHSFAIYLLLHGRLLKVVSQLLGHRSIESTEIYTNGRTVDGAHFLDGVDFH